MAYDKKTKELVTALGLSGIPAKELAEEYGISRPTITLWIRKKKEEDAEGIDTIKNIKKQLATLSKRKPTEAVSRKIAMLSKSLAALERMQGKKEEAQQKKIPKISLENTPEAMKVREWALSDEAGLYGYQREFLQSDEQFRFVVKSRQIGFSFVAALDALIGALSGRNQLFLSASEEQALILMGYLDYWAKKIRIGFEKDTDKVKTLENGAVIKALAHNFRTVQGFTGDVWMDEFAWYPNPKKIWHAFVPSIGAIKGRLTIMSTPFEEQSLFHDLYVDETKYFMFKRFRIDIYKAMEDGLPFDLNIMRALFDAETWASAYECQFIDDDSSLFSIALIKSCVDTNFSYFTPSSKEVLFMGYDIGRVKDSSALAGLVIKDTNYQLAIMETLRKAKFDEQKSFLKTYMNRYELGQIKIDKTGIGMNISENITDAYRRRASGVYFTAGIKEHMSLNLKKLFEDKRITIPNDPLLIADIHAIKRKAGAKSFLYDSDRNAHGHADRYWALALAAAHVQVVRTKKSGGIWIM